MFHFCASLPGDADIIEGRTYARYKRFKGKDDQGSIKDIRFPQYADGVADDVIDRFINASHYLRLRGGFRCRCNGFGNEHAHVPTVADPVFFSLNDGLHAGLVRSAKNGASIAHNVPSSAVGTRINQCGLRTKTVGSIAAGKLRVFMHLPQTRSAAVSHGC